MNNHRSFNNLFSKGAMEDAAHKRVVGGTVSEQSVMQRAIVIDLTRDAELSPQQSIIKPHYSIKARIIGTNQNKDNPDLLQGSNIDQWYAPLMPIHSLSLPEIGEEVLILRESTKQQSKGYWVSRINETSVINSYIKGEQTNNNSLNNVSKYGLNINPYDLKKTNSNISPSDYNISYGIPVYYGDVIQQGRTNTFLRHSFNPRNKLGVFEMGITKKRVYNTDEFDDIATLGDTVTKTVHLSQGNLSDISGISKYTTDNKKDKNIICNIAEEIYNFSNSKIAENSLFRNVLGERLTEFQEELLNNNIETLNTLEKLNDVFLDLMDVFLNHIHVLPEINIEIPDKEIKTYDEVRKPDKIILRKPKVVQVWTGEYIPGTQRKIYDKVTIERPPLRQPGGIKKTMTKNTIQFEKITIGGEGEKRETTTPVEDKKIININNDISNIYKEYKKETDNFRDLILKKNNMLSSVNFIN